jgi:single-strand DNA-binding protein
MNTVIVSGRIGRDPELQITPEKGMAITKFSLAEDQYDYSKKEKVAQWWNCVAFGATAEKVEKYIVKGMKITVVGELRIRDYTDREGVKRKSIDLTISNYEIHVWPKDGAPAADPAPYNDDDWNPHK